jgi:hypothetical protein
MTIELCSELQGHLKFHFALITMGKGGSFKKKFLGEELSRFLDGLTVLAVVADGAKLILLMIKGLKGLQRAERC